MYNNYYANEILDAQWSNNKICCDPADHPMWIIAYSVQCIFILILCWDCKGIDL